MAMAMAKRENERQMLLDEMDKKLQSKINKETKALQSRFDVALYLGKLQKEEDHLMKVSGGGKRMSLREKILSEKQNAAEESLAALKAEAQREARERQMMEIEEKA